MFGSVCSGIEAASAAWRECVRCHEAKPLTEFHKHKTGRSGHHSWCGVCANAAQKASRQKNGRPTAKRAWNLKSRYGLSQAEFDKMLVTQNGICAICALPMQRVCIDHNHSSGAVRGLLCHNCNIKLPAVENADYRNAAIAYLARFK